MLEPSSESFILLREVPKLPFLAALRPGKRLNLSTIWRWANRGVRGRKLETYRVGGAVCTTISALERFFASGAASTENFTQSSWSNSAKLRQKGVEEALDQLGIGVTPQARPARKSSSGERHLKKARS